MRRRVFLLSVSALYASFAAAAWTIGALRPAWSDAGAVLIAAASAVGFALAAWVEGDEPAVACGACGRGALAGFAFCTSCGDRSTLSAGASR